MQESAPLPENDNGGRSSSSKNNNSQPPGRLVPQGTPCLVHEQQLRGACDERQQLSIWAPGSSRQAALHCADLLHLWAAAGHALWAPQQQHIPRGQGQAEGFQLGTVVEGSHCCGIQARFCRLESLPQVHKPQQLHM